MRGTYINHFLLTIPDKFLLNVIRKLSDYDHQIIQRIASHKVPNCSCCKTRYAASKYDTGASYCKKCENLLPNKGNWIGAYATKGHLFVSV